MERLWAITLTCAIDEVVTKIKSGEIPPIALFARRWYEKYGKLPTEQDFVDKLQKFRAERDRVYELLCGLNSEELKKVRNDTSVRRFFASGLPVSCQSARICFEVRDLGNLPTFFKQSVYRRKNLVNGFWLAQESINAGAPGFLFAIVSRKHDDRRVASVRHAPRTED